MCLPSEYESSTTFLDSVIAYQRVCVTDDLTGAGDVDKVGQGHQPSKATKRLPRCIYLSNMKLLAIERNKEVAKMRLPSEYESSTTFGDSVIAYQRVCVTDELTGAR